MIQIYIIITHEGLIKLSVILALTEEMSIPLLMRDIKMSADSRNLRGLHLNLNAKIDFIHLLT